MRSEMISRRVVLILRLGLSMISAISFENSVVKVGKSASAMWEADCFDREF